MKLDILAIGVHPDDIELGCGGTIIKHVDLGYKVGMVDLSQGELGTRGNAQLRLEEAEAARRYAKVLIRENLKLPDGFMVNDYETKVSVIKIIRKYQPTIVLSNAIEDRHPDHGKASQLVKEACYLSGLSKIETQLDGHNQKSWRPTKVLNYIQDHYIKPDLVVDISGYFDRKMEMVGCFKSQFYDPHSGEAETPISSQQFLDHLKGRAIDHGRRIGVRYGEGFTSSEYIGVEDLFKIK